ncbi:O-antigen ligase family protein [Rhodococcus sp. IEGM 1374]|uniref:O-antigen ligase family protein n=1 Tax=Rhodococcus sp. IEGM 1374 TaxID=3082221 RepID=UPI0029552D48|nr:O-antigen ligase family protein [Rhodococcus sp. IEGM 1374]MDV7991225.1 O-antigen ligase family protein [Rhodococcus sp. IEGM 1374]
MISRPAVLEWFWIVAVVAASLVGSALVDYSGSTPFYLIALALVLLRAINPARPAKSARIWPFMLFAALALWGLFGSLAGRLVYGQTANSLALFVPLLIPVVDVLRRRAMSVDYVRNGFMFVSAAYCVTAVFVVGFGSDIVSEVQFRHQTSYFLAMSLATALILRSAWLSLLSVLATVVCFLAYPALTYVLVIAVTFVVVALHSLPRRLSIPALWLGVVFLVAVVSFRSKIEELRIGYFESVGKTDNTRTREVLYEIGVTRLREQPAFGSFFVDNIAVRAPNNVTGPFKFVPLHNDYLQIAVAGGLIFVALLLVSLFGIILVAVNSILKVTDRDNPNRSVTSIALATLLAMLVIAIFNPILVEPGAAIVLALTVVILSNATAQEGNVESL